MPNSNQTTETCYRDMERTQTKWNEKLQIFENFLTAIPQRPQGYLNCFDRGILP